MPDEGRHALTGRVAFGFGISVLELGLNGCGRSSSPAQAAFVAQSMPVTRVVKAALEIPEVVADSLELAARVRVLPPRFSGGLGSAGPRFQFSSWLPAEGAGRLRNCSWEDFTVHSVRSPLPFPSHRRTDL